MPTKHRTYTFSVTGYLAGGQVAPGFARPWLRVGREASEAGARKGVKAEFREEFPEYKIHTHVMPEVN